MIKKYFVWILVLLIIVDSVYSFLQHYYIPLDGDLVNAMSDPFHFKFIYNDLLGIKALLHREVHPDPNRFFVPLFIYGYFKNVPLWLQSFTNPINSVYLSCALFKTSVQLAISLILANAISPIKNGFNQFVVALVLIIPLFQTYGFSWSMGIIDYSITYTFFYAFPLVMLLLFFMPFYPFLYNAEMLELSFLKRILLLILVIIISFNGPLIPGIVLIVCPLILLHYYIKFYRHGTGLPFISRLTYSLKQMPKDMTFFFVFISILSLYSTYIGLVNSTFFNSTTISLTERFCRLPVGLYILASQTIGLYLMLFVIITNGIIIKKWFYNSNGKKILNLYKWGSIFALLYILLLPFGGYRVWRPNIIRYDTFMPVTIMFIFFFGLSTKFLIDTLKSNYKIIYLGFVSVVLLIFTIADSPHFHQNDCERQKFEEMASSKDAIVKLDANCSVLSWGITSNYLESENQARIIYNWKITKEKKLFYQK